MIKTFGTIQAEVELNVEDEQAIFLTFKIRRLREGATYERVPEFEENLFKAMQWVLKCFHTAEEKNHTGRLHGLLKEFSREDKTAGIEVDLD